MSISFDRSLCRENADFLENLSGTLLAPFHITFGRIFLVSEDINSFSPKKINTIVRIATGILFTALLPVSIVLSLLGFALSKLSSSYSRMYGIYLSCHKHEEAQRLILPGERSLLEELHQIPLTTQQAAFAASAKALALELQGGNERARLFTVSNFIHNARKLENEKAMSLLIDDLTKIVGAELAEECSKDPAIIGEDVLKNIALLTKARRSLIVKKVKELHKDVASIREALPQLKENLKNHLPCSETIVQKLHPEFSGLPQIGGKTGEVLINEYNAIINQALIEAEIKLKRRHRGGALEKIVLQNLGYEIGGDYDNLDIAKEAMTTIYQRLSKQGEITKPTAEFRDNLTLLATMMRYQLAGVPTHLSMAVHRVIEKIQDLDVTLSDLMVTPFTNFKVINGNFLSLIQNKLPKAYQRMQIRKRYLLTLEKNRFRNEFVQGLKPLFTSGLDPDHLQNVLYEKCADFIETARSDPHVDENAIEAALLPNLEFYKLFLNEGVKAVEYSQGEDGLGTVLGTGVCLMMCFELDKELIHDPEAPFETLHLNQIDPEVRFNHAMYRLHFIQKKDSSSKIPEPVLKRSKLKQISFKSMRTLTPHRIESMFAKIAEQEDALQESNPALQIGFEYKEGGHAVFIRFDKERGRYIFRDPNYLTAELLTHDHQKGISWLKQVLSVLMLRLYPETTAFTATHINATIS